MMSKCWQEDNVGNEMAEKSGNVSISYNPMHYPAESCAASTHLFGTFTRVKPRGIRPSDGLKERIYT